MSPNDLADLSDLKTWLGIASSGDDAMLGSLITDISVAILADLGRGTILPAIYNEAYDGGGPSIMLRQWPVGDVLEIGVDGMSIDVIGSTSPARSKVLSVSLDMADAGPPGVMQRVSINCGELPKGRQNVKISYRAGYEISSEAAIVPNAPPYIVTAAAPYGAWRSDGGVAYASGDPLQLAAGAAPGVYAVVNGTYTFDVQDAGAAITLRYGYVPADLARACCDWAADRYAARTRIGQSSKTLGGQETAAFIVKAMPDFVSRLLQLYRRIVRP